MGLMLSLGLIFTFQFLKRQSSEVVTLEPITSNAKGANLVDMTWLPGTSSLITISKGGSIVLLESLSGSLKKIGEFRIGDFSQKQGCGAASITIDPDFSTNNFLFVAHCNAERQPTVTRLLFSRPNFAKTWNSAQRIIAIPEAAVGGATEMMGSITFDKSKNMLWGIGDYAITYAAQDLRSPLGKILRFSPSRKDVGGYTIPPDNPNAKKVGVNELVFAYGLRAPWKIATDEENDIWIADIREKQQSHIFIQTEALQNFGWGMTKKCPNCIEPRATWSSQTDGLRLPELKRIAWVGKSLEGRKIIIGDWCTGLIWNAKRDLQGNLEMERLGILPGISAVTTASNGDIYFLQYSKGLPRSCLLTGKTPLSEEMRRGEIFKLRN